MTDTGVSGAYQYGSQPQEQMGGDPLEQARLQALNLDILRMTSPWLFENPEAANTLATSGFSPDQVATQGAEIYAMQNMEGMKQTLQGMSAVGQRSAFDQLTQPQRAAMRNLGYSPPDAEGGGGLPGLGIVGDAVGYAWSGVSEVGGAVLGPTLDFMEFVGDQPAHLYRTIRTMDAEYQWLALGAAVATGGVLGLGIGLAGGGAAALAGGMGMGTIGAAGAVGMTALGGATATAAIFGRGAWWDAFQATADGERVFSAGAQKTARELLQNDSYINLAKQVALELGEDMPVLWDLATEVAGERGAGSMSQMTGAIERLAGDIAEPGSPEYQTAYAALNQLVMEEPFQQAVSALNAGKISFGRDIANLAQLDPGSTSYNLISGAADAAWLWGMDPFMGAGALRRANMVRKYGIPPKIGAAEQLDWFRNLSNNNAKIRAVHEQVALGMRMGRPDLLPKASRGQYLDLLEWAAKERLVDTSTGRITDFTRQNFLEWVEFGGGMKSILSGQGTVRGMERAVLSTVNTSQGWGRFVDEARQFVDVLDDGALDKRMARIAKKHGVDMDLESVSATRALEQPMYEGGLVPATSIDESAAGGVGQALGEVFVHLPGTKTVGKFLGSISSMAPAGAAVKMVGDGSEESIRRYIDSMGRTFGLPKAMRDEWLTAITVQGNTSQRMNVMQSYLDSLMTASGLRLTDEGSKMADQFLYMHRHAYALGGTDQLVANGRTLTRGWLPEAHSATHLLMPNLMELQKAVRRQDMFGQILRITDSNLVENSMNRVWKPMVLLRIGFIPRAAGEEALAWFARATTGGIMQEIGARNLAGYKAYHAARKLADEGVALTAAQARHAQYDKVGVMSPLHWMLARKGFKNPYEETLDTFSSGLARFLDDGFMKGDDILEAGSVVDGTQRVVTRGQQFARGLDDGYRTLLLGKEHSWRHLIIGGIDPALKEAGDAWVLRHADAIMRGASTTNHSLVQHEVLGRDRQTQLVANPEARSGVQAEDILTMKGQRARTYKQDPAYDAAAHHRILEPLFDAVHGPAISTKYTHHFPEEFTTLTPPQFRDAAVGADSIKSWAGRHIASNWLTPRDDAWRATANIIEASHPEVAKVIKGMAYSGEPITIDRLGSALLDVRGQLEADHQFAAAKAIDILIEEIEGIRPFVELAETLPPNELGWLQGAIGNALYEKKSWYDPAGLNAFADGTTEAKRPERVFFRGVKNGETIEQLPDGSLLLRPQSNDDWGRNVVSMSIFPDQSLGYAVSPAQYNSGAGTSAGAMIEIDGDAGLAAVGATWDEVSGTPRFYNQNLDDAADGAHLIGHEPGTVREPGGRALQAEDAGEIAFVGDGNLIIPAGKWRIQTGEDMKAVSAQVAEAGDSRWPWLANVSYETPSGIAVDDIQRDLVDAVDRLKLEADEFGEMLPTDEQIEEFARYLRALDPEEMEIVQQFTGLRYKLDPAVQYNVGEEIYDGYTKTAQQILRNADEHTGSIKEALALRGAGGFGEEAVWSPFTTNSEDLWRGMGNELEGSMMRPENGEHMRLSQRAGMSGEVHVADQVPDGMDRVYIPKLESDPEIVRSMDRVLETGLNPADGDLELKDFVEAVIDDLLNQPHTYRMHGDFIRNLDEGPVRNGLAQAVKQFVLEGRNKHILDNSGMALPMFGAGYSDPRMAQWIGDVLSGGVKPPPSHSLGYVHIPRAVNRETGGIKYVSNYGPGGQAYEFDGIIDANIRNIDADNITQMPDGSHQAGAAFTRGIQDHRDVSIDLLKQAHTGGQNEIYRLNPEMEGQVFRSNRPGSKDPVGLDEVFDGPTDLFDADQNPIDWNDPRLFIKEMAGESDQQMHWEVLGPALADAAAQRNEMVKLAPREMKSLRSNPNYVVDETASQSVVMSHARITDVEHVKPRLPNASITEVPKPVKSGIFQKGVRWGFDNVIGPAIDSLVRRPMAFHYFAAAHKQNMRYTRWMLDDKLHASVDKVFGKEIALLDELAAVTPEIAHDVKLIDHKWYNTIVDDMDDDLITKWIGSHAGSQQEWQELTTEAAFAARAEHQPDVAEAWERLGALDQGPYRTSGISVGETSTEKFILAYRNQVPAGIRSDGPKAVNRYIKTNNLGLPHVDDYRLNTIDAAIKNWDHVYEMVEETATIRALENVIPFLDDHTERSQFAVAARNFLPFWYAEELFLKRWARTLQIAPEALRKGQLTYMGLRNAGVVRSDANGNDWVVYPGSGMLTSFISTVTPWKTVDVGSLMQTNTQSLLPGLNSQMGSPALSPLAAMPVDFLTQQFPELVNARQALLGPVGANSGKGPLEAAMTQVVPASIQRFWRAARGNEANSVQYANAVAYTMAARLAEDPHFLDNADPMEIEEFLDQTRSHARVVMFAQAVGGFVAPGAPTIVNSGEDFGSFAWMTGIGVENPDAIISPLYRSYIKGMGLDEGTRKFLKDFPFADLQDVVADDGGALAYVQSTTSSVSGAPLPANRTGMAWYEENRAWVDGQTHAGAWFLPHDQDGDEFDFYSYSQQATYELRKRETPEEFLKSMIYRTAAGEYFESKDKYEATKAQIPADNQYAQQAITAQWESWQTTFLGSHPVFAAELTSNEAKNRRANTIEQLRYAVSDPQAPESPHSGAIKEMSEAFDNYMVIKRQLAVNRSQRNIDGTTKLKEAYSEWVAGWILRNPQLERLWSSVYKPQANL